MDGPAWRLLLWGLSSWRFRKRSAMVSPSYRRRNDLTSALCLSPRMQAIRSKAAELESRSFTCSVGPFGKLAQIKVYNTCDTFCHSHRIEKAPVP